jgi:putative addiction module killer protein
METDPYRIAYYTNEIGKKPFREWLLELRDQVAAVRIRARLTRVRAGNFGAVRSVGEGVMELKIDHGPGYRIYYAIDAGTIVLLLCGGDKRTQQRDIETAQKFWKNHQELRK